MSSSKRIDFNLYSDDENNFSIIDTYLSDKFGKGKNTRVLRYALKIAADTINGNCEHPFKFLSEAENGNTHCSQCKIIVRTLEPISA